MNLKDYLNKALKEGWALPHFNISDAVTLRGICEAAKELGSPLVIGTSEGEREFVGLRQAVAMIQAFREEYGLPIFLNADHHKSAGFAEEAIDAGYDSAHIDLSVMNLEENINGTSEVVRYASVKNKNTSIEGEAGYLMTESSRIYKEIIEIPPESLTKLEEAARFVKETGVDRFAPAVGNLHGISANAPQLDFERIKAIRKAIGDEVALVLHGGSGIPNDQIKEAIKCGINNIHINTEIRVAYSGALRKFLADHPDETTPYKFFAPVIDAVKQKAAEKINLFGSQNRI